MKNILKKAAFKIISEIRRLRSKKIRYIYPSTSSGWIKYPGPVIGGGKVYFDPCVIRVEDSLYMYVSNRTDNTIDLYSSLDGFEWRYVGIALSHGEAGSWDSMVNRCSVLYHDGYYYMWYTGQTEITSKIGLAISRDGIEFGRSCVDPVLVPGLSHEKNSVMNPNVIWDEEERIFKMWYSAGEKYEPDVICYATCKDGINWDKHKSPVLAPSDLEYDRCKVGGCCVSKYNSSYEMYYIGYQTIDNARICRAGSPDGINWSRDRNNPIISPSRGSWDEDAIYKPSCFSLKEQDFICYNARKRHYECIGLVYRDR